MADAQPFVWGAGGARMTPEQIAAQRKVAQAMMEKGGDYSPVQSGWQGAARVAQAMMGGFESGQADAASKANADAESKLLSDLFGGGTPAATPAAAPAPTAPASTPPMGATAIPAGREEFTNTVMPLAQEAAARTGLDPRLIVAQAALETGWGKSAPGGNLFGIKSHGQVGGNTLPTTEIVNGQPVRTTDSFRAYASPADSVKGYADFITSNPRYKPMLQAQDLDAQVAALGRSGYATDPQYGAKVGSIARGLPVPGAPAAQPVQMVEGDGASPLDTAQWPAGPVGSPAVQTVDANSPSPLDTAQWPAGPVGNPATMPAQPQATAAPAPAQAAAPGLNPKLLQAMSSPYISDGTKKVLGMMLSQQMTLAQQAADPKRALEMDKLRADIGRINGKTNGPTEYGLNPIYGKDEQGNDVLGTIGKDGSFKRIDTGGVKVQSGVDKVDLGTHWQLRDKRTGQVIGVEPKNIATVEQQKVTGEAQGKSIAAAPGDLQSGQNALDILDKIEKHPGLDRGTGITSLANVVPGTVGYDFANIVEQAKSGAFLSAIQQMRGMGSLSNAEGQTATAAVTRMNTATSKEAFLEAVADYRKIVNQGMERARSNLRLAPDAAAPPPKGKTTSGVSWSVE